MAAPVESVSEELADILTRRQVYLTRYGNFLAREVSALLKKSDARVLAKLAAIDGETFTKRRSVELLAAIRRLVEASLEDFDDQLRKELVGLAVAEREFVLAALKQAYPIRVSWTAPLIESMRVLVVTRPFLGSPLSEYAGTLARQKVLRLTRAVRSAWVEGQTIPELMRTIRDLLKIETRHAESVARTSVNFVSNAVRQDVYDRNSDLIKGIRWVSTLDGRTTPICITRDGQIYPIDSGPRPPAHYNCRSTTAPVTKSWAELGFDVADKDKPLQRPFIADRRAAKNIPPSARARLIGSTTAQTYAEWLRKQSHAFQADVFDSEERAAIFRRGELPITRFVNDQGKWLTLDQLKAREHRALRSN